MIFRNLLLFVAEKTSTRFLMQIGCNRHQIPAESQELVPQTSKSLESSGCLFVCLLLVCSGDLQLAVPVELGIRGFHGIDSWFCMCVSPLRLSQKISQGKSQHSSLQGWNSGALLDEDTELTFLTTIPSNTDPDLDSNAASPSFICGRS